MTWVVAIGGALLLGIGVPWLTIRMLAPTLAECGRVQNYRGRPVFVGLGISWLVWAGAAIAYGVMVGSTVDAGVMQAGSAGGSVLEILTLAGPLALVAFALGVVDDAYGSSDARGFGGHLRALARGRLTTGGLKLIGISAASLVIGLVIAQIGAASDGGGWDAERLTVGVCAGAAIALTSNFVNLVDLRPGRALKVYAVLAVLGTVSTAVFLPLRVDSPAHPLVGGTAALDGVCLLLFLAGPVIATWSHDLGERGMLGDAGANPMGAVAGMLIVVGLPAWGLVAYLVLLLGLNLASERVSFSRVIEGNGVLSWLDGLGRPSARDSSAGCGE